MGHHRYFVSCPLGFCSDLRQCLLPSLTPPLPLRPGPVNILTLLPWLPSFSSLRSYPSHHVFQEAYSGPSEQPTMCPLAADNSSFIILMRFAIGAWWDSLLSRSFLGVLLLHVFIFTRCLAFYSFAVGIFPEGKWKLKEDVALHVKRPVLCRQGKGREPFLQWQEDRGEKFSRWMTVDRC